jgi:hypothetical protein
MFYSNMLVLTLPIGAGFCSTFGTSVFVNYSEIFVFTLAGGCVLGGPPAGAVVALAVAA